MGDGFQELSPGCEGSSRLQGNNKVSGDVGRIYRHTDGHCVIFREDKVEMGSAGDAYTQVASSFDEVKLAW